jgi:hypothetical protein
VLWVDAICICQADTKERNIQVSRMADIYRSAERVISWSGLEMQDSVQSAMVFLSTLFVDASLEHRRLLERLRQNRRMRPHYDKLLKLLEGLLAAPLSDQAMTDARPKSQDWRDVMALFSLRYWRRLWIVQEVVLARQFRVQCGSCFIDGRRLIDLLVYLKLTSRAADALPSYVLRVADTAAAKVLYYKCDMEQLSSRSGGLGLVDTLVGFAHTRCGDPRDKIYGLLGIAGDVEGLKPDYGQTPLGLYNDLVSMPRFRTDDGLVSFSQLLQHLMGGLFHPRNTMVPGGNPGERQQPGTFFTRGAVCGSVSILGETFTTVDRARALLIDWHSLYFHRVRRHYDGDELPSSMRDSLLSIGKDAKKAVAIDSRLSYSYFGRQRFDQPTWEQVSCRYLEPGPGALNKGASLANPAPGDTPAAEQPPDPCPGPHPGEICRCLCTSRLALRPRWAIGTRGQVGLVPGNAKDGDIICHFQNSDVAAVVRPFADGWFHFIVGGALMMRQWDEAPAKPHDRSLEVFKYSIGTRRRDAIPFDETIDQMSFHFDRKCLQLLTCPASDLGPFLNEEPPPLPPSVVHYTAAHQRRRPS